MKEVGAHLLTYEAVLSNTNNLARVTAARHAIERAGGKLRTTPMQHNGMTLVVLTLPDTYTPDVFLPGLPFYPSPSDR